MSDRSIDRLHVLSRKLERRKSSPLRKLRRLTGLAAAPITALGKSWKATGIYGPAVEQAFAIPRVRQAFSLWGSVVRYGFSPEDYYRYRMYLFSSQDAGMFFPLGRNMTVREYLYRKLSLDPAPLADKRLFYRACQKAQLPVPHTIADFDAGQIHWWTDPALPGGDLFCKEAAAMCGAGAARWNHDMRSHRWTGQNGQTLDADSLIRHLCALSDQAPLILQCCAKNHPELDDLGPSGLCTVRVVTVRQYPTEAPSLLLAAFRMPTDGGVADNFALGGLACAVDETTGVLGPAVRKSVSQAYLDLTHHPNTGAPIERRTLPMWQQVLDLARCAHNVFSSYPSIGWDIAITPAGPLVIEANYNWDVVLAQQAGSRPLGATPFATHVLSWLDAGGSGNTR